MRNYRNERLRLAAAALAALFLFCPAGFAQDQPKTPNPPPIGPPIRLIPPPPPDQMFPANGTPAAPGNGNGPAVEATPLAPVDSSWVGAIDEADRPLPQTMW